MKSPKGLVKKCKSCDQSKELSKYHLQRSGFLGRNSVCKECRKKKSKNRKITANNESLVLCNKCNLRKTANKFYKNSCSNNGLQSYCKICQKENIAESRSKLNNFVKIVLKKFKNKNKDKVINLKYTDIIRKFNQQSGKCYLTNHIMTHNTDLKQRTDNIWNLSICCDLNLKTINYSDFKLGIHLIYTMKHIYELSDGKIKKIYQDLANN